MTRVDRVDRVTHNIYTTVLSVLSEDAPIALGASAEYNAKELFRYFRPIEVTQPESQPVGGESSPQPKDSWWKCRVDPSKPPCEVGEEWAAKDGSETPFKIEAVQDQIVFVKHSGDSSLRQIPVYILLTQYEKLIRRGTLERLLED